MQFHRSDDRTPAGLYFGLFSGLFIGLAMSASAHGEKVVLGDPSLTAGIPGSGPLTTEQINAWLANPANHEVLEIELPQGLAGATANIRGIEENPLTRAKIELGRQLYMDTRLSADSTISCASCHDPNQGFAKQTQFGEGIRGQKGNRNSPTAYNRILSSTQFWDGRAASLEEQAKGPIANPIEMGYTHDACVKRIAGIPGYSKQFAAVFGGPVTIDHVAAAIAAFERTLVTGPSPYDFHDPLKKLEEAYGDELTDLAALKESDPELAEQYKGLKEGAEAHPMSDSAKRGQELFFGKANCTACHLGANFTDEGYHNLGVGMEAKEPDLGRYVITKEEKDKGAFKTPTIRNVALTAPYMHDGSQKTLEEVVEWYDKGGHANPHLSEKVKPLKLSAQEKADLVEFMKACTGSLPVVQPGRIPQ